MVELSISRPITPDNPYLQTEWRKSPSWGDGGFFVDTFVHDAAALRLILGDFDQVSSVVSSRAKHIPGWDTLTAHVTWKSGVHGTIALTHAAAHIQWKLQIMGPSYYILLERDGPGYKLKYDDVNSSSVTFFPFKGTEAQFTAFAGACHSESHSRDINTPAEALKDLEFVYACLESGTAYSVVKTV